MADAGHEVAEEYKDALVDLNSSKPQITFLTMLADENKKEAKAIVGSIFNYAHTVSLQLERLIHLLGHMFHFSHYNV